MTGGKAFYNNNDISGLFKRAVDGFLSGNARQRTRYTQERLHGCLDRPLLLKAGDRGIGATREILQHAQRIPIAIDKCNGVQLGYIPGRRCYLGLYPESGHRRCLAAGLVQDLDELPGVAISPCTTFSPRPVITTRRRTWLESRFWARYFSNSFRA